MDRVKDNLTFNRVIFIPFVLLTLFLYQTTTISLLELWTSGNSKYSHGLALLGIAMVLFYQRWMSIQSLQLQPNIAGTLLLVATSLVWFVANVGHVQLIEQLCLPFLLISLLWSVLGLSAAKTLAFPILLLFFAIPIWDYLNVYLQRGTAAGVGALMSLTGIPSVREGLFILVPAGTFVVTEYCSGLAQFIVAITIGALYAYLRRLRLLTGLLCVAMAMLTAFLTNIIRISIIVIVGERTGMKHALMTDHNWLGWLVFGGGMIAFLLLLNRYLRSDEVGKHESGGDSAEAKDHEAIAPRMIIIQGTLAGFLGLTIGPALAHVYQSDSDGPYGPSKLILAVPDEISEWRADKAYGENYRPSFQGADASHETIYRNTADEVVYLHIAYYRFQRQGKEAIHYSNRVDDGVNWIAVTTTTTNLIPPPLRQAKETAIRSPRGDMRIVWHWYYVRGTWTSSELLAKALNIWGILNDDPDIVVFTIAVDPNKYREKSRTILNQFIVNAAGTLEHSVDSI